jgi:hypothetical protein
MKRKVDEKTTVFCDHLQRKMALRVCLGKHLVAIRRQKGDDHFCAYCPQVIEHLDKSKKLRYQIVKYLREVSPRLCVAAHLAKVFETSARGISTVCKLLADDGLIDVFELHEGKRCPHAYRLKTTWSDGEDNL